MEEFVGEPVPSEDALWALLERLLEKPGESAEIGPLWISGWRPRLLYYPLEEQGHSIRPSVARAVSDYHASLSQAYALLAYGAANRLLLRSEDKEVLDLSFLVINGSTGLETDDDAINSLVTRLVGKMSGNQVLISIVLFLLLYFGTDTAKHWITEHYNAKAAYDASKERIELSEKETERLKIFADAMTAVKQGPLLADKADDAKRALIRPSTQSDRTNVLGVEVTREQATTILSSERQKAEGHRLDGIYRVISIDTESETGFVVRIEHIETKREFSADANYGEIPDEDIHVIFAAAENKDRFDGIVNVTYLGEKISRGSIIRATAIKEDGAK